MYMYVDVYMYRVQNNLAKKRELLPKILTHLQGSVEEAMEWMLAHTQDSDLNSPFEQSGSSDTTSVDVEALLAKLGDGF